MAIDVHISEYLEDALQKVKRGSFAAGLEYQVTGCRLYPLNSRKHWEGFTALAVFHNGLFQADKFIDL